VFLVAHGAGKLVAGLGKEKKSPRAPGAQKGKNSRKICGRRRARRRSPV
jgi:hypothetical protein